MKIIFGRIGELPGFSGTNVQNEDVKLLTDFRLKRNLLSIRRPARSFSYLKPFRQKSFAICGVMVNANLTVVIRRVGKIQRHIVRWCEPQRIEKAQEKQCPKE